MITRIVFVRIGENDVKTKEHEGNLRKNIKGNQTIKGNTIKGN